MYIIICISKLNVPFYFAYALFSFKIKYKVQYCKEECTLLTHIILLQLEFNLDCV